MVEAGAVRANNVKSILLKNMSDLCIGSIGWALTGFGIAFGTDNGNGLWGTDKYFGDFERDEAAFFLFQLAFACTAATIVSGAVAERIKLSAYFWNSFLILIVIYPWACHWVWSEGGWLQKEGFRDFAGSLVVHSVGGFCGLVVSKKIGPRIGRYDDQLGIVMEIPPHSMVLTALGTWILLFGWFGFNPGSTMGLADGQYETAARAGVNTLLSGVVSVITTIMIMILVIGEFNLSHVMNALLGGLVSITGPCGFVSIGGAMAIGALGGIFYAWGSHTMLHKFKVDDPVDAFCVHGVCGFWGVVAPGFFDTEEGLFYGGGVHLLGVQLYGAAIVISVIALLQFCFITALDEIYKMQEKPDPDRARNYGDRFLKLGIRISPEIEIKGCDSEFSGSAAYSFLEEKTTLEEVLVDAELCAAWRQFLIQLHTDENLDFYEEVLAFEALEQHLLVDAATVIYMKYFKTGSPTELNIRGGLKKNVADALGTADRKIFEHAKNEALQMMKDTFTGHFQDSAELNRILAVRKEAKAAERRPPLHCLATICCGVRRRNKEEMNSMTIEEQMMDHKLEEIMTQKLLVLGAGEAGKTTLVNQLITIFNHGITSTAVRDRAKVALRVNVFMTLHVLIRKLEEMGLTSKLSDAERTNLERLKQHDPAVSGYSLKDAQDVTALWKSSAMQEVWDNRNTFWLLSNGKFYLDNAIRFADKPGQEYVPTNRDMAKSRKKTTGVNVSSFYEKASKWGECFADSKTNPGDVLQFKWDVVDVGGQRSERRKWMAYFDNVHAVFFVLNLNGYQEVLYEDENKLRIKESMELFRDTFQQAKGKGLKVDGVPVFVVFNKLEFFEDNWNVQNFITCFPRSVDAVKTAKDGLLFMQQAFREIAQNEAAIKMNMLDELWDFENAINAIEIDDCGGLLNKCCKKVVELNGRKMVAQLPEVMPAIKRRWRVKQNKDKAAAAFKSRSDGGDTSLKKVSPMDQV
jgi:Amt family ammonium transporter